MAQDQDGGKLVDVVIKVRVRGISMPSELVLKGDRLLFT